MSSGVLLLPFAFCHLTFDLLFLRLRGWPCARKKPLTRPAPAGENAGSGPPSPLGRGQRNLHWRHPRIPFYALRPWRALRLCVKPFPDSTLVLQHSVDIVLAELVAAFQELEFDQESETRHLPPSDWTSCAAAAAVPPVASRSSTIKTSSPGLMASRWISSASAPSSRL